MVKSAARSLQYMRSAPSHEKRSWCRILCSVVLSLAFVATGIGLAVHYFGTEEQKKQLHDNIPDLPEGLENLPETLWEFIDDIKIFHREDPFNGNPSDANRWRTNGKDGLELELVNALDDIWVPYFDVSVQEWDEGAPDTLTLSTRRQAPDSECSPIAGVMKVCNGNYGRTDWKGINKVLLQGGWITTSMARMNDEFFGAFDDDKRHYTMCHEIGHGFGLPHTDETFWNRDLGNCLDYTTRYAGNKSPDDSLFNFLYKLYGSVDGSVPTNTAMSILGPDDRKPAKGGGRKLRVRSRGIFDDVRDPVRRRELMDKWNEIDRVETPPSHWRLLHRTKYSEAHEIELDDTYTVQIHKLLPL